MLQLDSSEILRLRKSSPPYISAYTKGTQGD